MSKLIYNNGTKELELSFNSPFWINSIEGLSENNVDISSSQGVSQIGATVTATSIQPKTITLNGTIMGVNAEYRKTLISTILPGVAGKLFYDDYYIDCMPSKTPVISNGLSSQEFQVTLFCAYPFWRSKETQSESFLQKLSLFTFPFSTGTPFKISDISSSIYKTIINDGDTDSGLIVRLKAITDVENPKLLHVDKGTFLNFNYTLLAGETIEINTNAGEKSVNLTSGGVVSNAFKYLTVDSDMGLTASAGANLFQSIATDNVEGLDIEIELPKGVYTGV